MFTALLTTKLNVLPRRSNLVPCPRLIEWLDEGLPANSQGHAPPFSLYRIPLTELSSYDIFPV